MFLQENREAGCRTLSFIIKKKMKAYKVLLFFMSVMLALALVCHFFPKEGIDAGFATLKFPSVEDVFKAEEKKGISAETHIKEMEESLRIKHDTLTPEEAKEIAIQDSLERADSLAYLDTLKFYQDFISKHPARIYFPNNDSMYLRPLMIALDKQRYKKQMHIVHYGDSQIEGDRISGYIRRKFQGEFGGNGPGLIPAIQPIPSAALQQTYSGDLERYIIDGNHAQKAQHSRYGALAQVSELDGQASIAVSPRKEDARGKFSEVKLFVGNTSDDFIASITYKDTFETQAIGKAEKYACVSWKLRTPIDEFTLSLKGKAEIYGLSLGSECGVTVDNVPLRGSSGTFFTKLDKSVFRAMHKDLNTKLVLMEFGGNVMPVIKSQKNVDSYKKTIAANIQYVRSLCPNAKIILIGPADMSIKIDGKLQTYPWLEENIEGMKQAALENGAAFWNMYEVMGGYNSMINWVSNKPAWAASDYIHFTPKGANRIAEIFVESFMLYNDYYRFLSKPSKWHKNKKDVKRKS